MANDTEVLREFVVKLGFKVDEKSLKNFTGNTEDATRSVEKMVAVITGASLVAGAALMSFAAKMEDLYFAAQKTGSSATSLKAFEKAAQNFGAASGEALQSVQALARFMREEPGAEGILSGLGVQTRKANGELRSTAELIEELGVKLKDKPYYLQKQYADMFGIGENILLAFNNPAFIGELRKQKESLQNVGYDEAAKKSSEFEKRLRELQTRIEAVGVSVGLGALNFIDQYNPAIQGTIDLVSKLVDTLGKGAKFLMDFGFRATAGAFMMGRLATGDIKGAKEAAKAMVDGMDASLPGASPQKSSVSPKATESAPAGKSPGFLANPVSFFMGLGWSKEQSAGIVANLQRESRLNPNAVGDSGKAYGLAQWHPDRQANFAKWAGKDIRQSTADEQAAFVNYELTQGAERKAGMLLRAAQSAEFAGRVMSRHYERPKNAADEAALRGAAAVQIAQTTTINVNGGNAAATGQAVAGEQDRVNQRLARNAGGVVK